MRTTVTPPIVPAKALRALVPADGPSSRAPSTAPCPAAEAARALRYKLLVVEDDAAQLAILKEALSREGFSILTADNASDALACATDSSPDLVLADVGLLDQDGVALCKRLRSDKRTSALPVILVSGSRVSAESQVQGLEVGADDYVLKPFVHSVLVAKIRAVLRRRAEPGSSRSPLAACGVTLDVSSRTARVGARTVVLTRKEFDLLTVFFRRRGQVLSLPYLLETVWGYAPAEYSEPHTVQVHVSSLRRKLRSLDRRLVTVSGLGYRLDA